LDINQPNTKKLAAELARKLKNIDRTESGLEDFALEGIRAIEPGKPSHSFLFHALAAPRVGRGKVRAFPTPDHMEVVENYIYSLNRPSIADLRARVNGAQLALTVFVAEYRPGAQTVHKKHADFCYSRTGIARIGNEDKLYLGGARGFTSNGTRPDRVRVVPCRYSVYLAARLYGKFENFGPLGFHSVNEKQESKDSDSDRQFWVPLHKIFSGDECIQGIKSLDLRFRTNHRNEKLHRLQLYLIEHHIPTDHHGPEINSVPFIIPESQLALIEESSIGSLAVIPMVHELVEEAWSNNVRIGFDVPPDGGWSSAFRIPSRESGGRPAPELIYVRQKILANGTLQDLNGISEVAKFVNFGGYKAQLYIDHTGDGWIQAECDQLSPLVPQRSAAYSVLAAPDPYPGVKQQDLFEWWQNIAPPDVRTILFPQDAGSNPPRPLSDTRVTANITYRRPTTVLASTPIFDSSDDTYTAIVAGLNAGQDAQTRIDILDDERVSPLPDGAAGLFAPGWDVSIDFHEDEKSRQGVIHLAAYGGGSPFLEDVRLCAAEGAFWPAAAPDTARIYEPLVFKTVTPIPESKLGWDGMAAPTLNLKHLRAEFNQLDYSDYVLAAMGQRKRFDFTKLNGVTAAEYETWSLLMARVYEVLNFISDEDRIKWPVAYFDLADPQDKDLLNAQLETKIELVAPYRFVLIRPLCQAKNASRVQVTFERFVIAFANQRHVLFKDSQRRNWLARVF
jgi:hypothetical protein